MAKMLITTECPRKNRNPSSTEVVDAGLAPGTGGDGANPANTATAMKYVTASTVYALVSPNAPISTPPMAGPAIMPNEA